MTRPNFTGLWRLDAVKSHLPGLAVAHIGMKIEHDEPYFVQAVKTVFDDGRISLGRFAGDTSGAEFVNPFRSVSMRSTAQWAGAELVIDSRIETHGRTMHFRDHWSLSADGRELVMEHRDDDLAGQRTVLERAADAS